jgi:hypothetical protein
MIQQGTLNRLRGSVKSVSLPQLNVTAPYLTKAGITIAPEGDATTVLPTMTGVVTSPEPYLIVRVTINVLKTNGLAAAYKSQWEATSVIGDIVVTPDTSAIPTITVNNSSIVTIGELNIAGEEPGWQIVLTGYYNINNNLWSLT